MIRTTKSGFTLIEILIVVAIIAILASVVLVGLGPTQQAGRDARRISDLSETQNGLELYYNECGYYPGGAQATSPCGAYAANNTWAKLTAALTGSNIGITTVPNDPTTGANYFYAAAAGGTSYVVGAQLENHGNSVFNNYKTPTDPSVAVLTTTNASDTCAAAVGQYCVTL